MRDLLFVAQVSKPAVSRVSKPAAQPTHPTCRFGNRRHSRFGNLRYPSFNSRITHPVTNITQFASGMPRAEKFQKSSSQDVFAFQKVGRSYAGEYGMEFIDSNKI